jgi:hypothetical protein
LQDRLVKELRLAGFQRSRRPMHGCLSLSKTTISVPAGRRRTRKICIVPLPRPTISTRSWFGRGADGRPQSTTG